MLRYFFVVIKKLLLATLAISLAMGLGVQLWLAAWVWHYRDHPPTYTPFMHLGTGSPGAPKLRYQWVDRHQIAPALEQAVLAAEDARFMEHKGLDWDGIRRAYEKNKSAGSTVAGGSTLTQQLAKNLFLSRKKTYWRKAQEAFIALMMEQMLTKERILTLYLNVALWGHGIYGAEAAAQSFFHRSAQELTPDLSTPAGGSTPTQQLAKNLFRSRKKTYWRKAQEAFIALMMEQMLTKERILTLYLNVAQWGHGIYGAEAAAQYFFHRSAQELT